MFAVGDIACYFDYCGTRYGGWRTFSPERLGVALVAIAIFYGMMVKARKQDKKEYGTKGYHFKLIGRTAMLYEDNTFRLVVDAAIPDPPAAVVVHWSRLTAEQTRRLTAPDIQVIKIRIEKALEGRIIEWD